MEGLIFLVIIAVVSLLRGGGKKQQKRPGPPPRPKRSFLDMEPQGEQESVPPGRPARRTIFSDDTVYVFPKKRKEPKPVTTEREEWIAPKTEDLTMRTEEPQRIPHCEGPQGSKALFKDKNELARGIILAEILGPPVSKRKRKGFI